MSSSHHLLHAATELVHLLHHKVDEELPKEIAEIIKFHSAGAAAASVASGWLPGAGALAAAGICAGFIWTMYGRINSKIGLSLADNLLKTVATGVATNLAAGFVGAIALQTVFSFFPGIGSVAASAIAGATGYALTLASGYVYLKLLTKLFLSGKDPTTMNEAELKAAATSVAGDADVKEVMKDAKSSYKGGS